MNALIQEIINKPLQSLMIVANLFLIESLLSVDNAAVLATMLLKLPRAERKRALKYGLFGAYLFRGICLVLATYLVKVWWLKGLGGLYLLYLALQWILKKKSHHHEEVLTEESNWLYRKLTGSIGKFWSVVISVELMDLAFSLDNVFAAVAYSQNILIILTGVFIGILAMRFVAQGFVKLMETYSFLEGCAFTVIGLLGVKLSATIVEHFYPDAPLTHVLQNRMVDWVTSGLTIAIFLIPILTSWLFNFPKKKLKPSR